MSGIVVVLFTNACLPAGDVRPEPERSTPSSAKPVLAEVDAGSNGAAFESDVPPNVSDDSAPSTPRAVTDGGADGAESLESLVDGSSPKPATKEPDPFIGLRPAEVREWVSRGTVHGKTPSWSISGRPHLETSGQTWTIEWEPGGCNDWTSALILRFSQGRVADVTWDRRHRPTGKECF
jgi:hypothetical protein